MFYMIEQHSSSVIYFIFYMVITLDVGPHNQPSYLYPILALFIHQIYINNYPFLPYALIRNTDILECSIHHRLTSTIQGLPCLLIPWT